MGTVNDTICACVCCCHSCLLCLKPLPDHGCDALGCPLIAEQGLITICSSRDRSQQRRERVLECAASLEKAMWHTSAGRCPCPPQASAPSPEGRAAASQTAHPTPPPLPSAAPHTTCQGQPQPPHKPSFVVKLTTSFFIDSCIADKGSSEARVGTCRHACCRPLQCARI